ncbi:hypothetical protein GCM10018952_39040 [Streptosporangium vulgare]
MTAAGPLRGAFTTGGRPGADGRLEPVTEGGRRRADRDALAATRTPAVTRGRAARTETVGTESTPYPAYETPLYHLKVTEAETPCTQGA